MNGWLIWSSALLSGVSQLLERLQRGFDQARLTLLEFERANQFASLHERVVQTGPQGDRLLDR